MLVLAVIFFAGTYLALLALPRHRALAALVGGGCFVAAGILTPRQALAAVDWNVLLMIAGTMGLVQLFTESGMPAYLAHALLRHTRSLRAAVVALAVFAGVISAFIDNVATVLMVAPVALALARRAGVSPVPAVIAVAVSSNLQGAATLVGDTTSVLLGAAAGMDFADFFWYQGRPGLFWVVEAGAAVSALMLLWLFRVQKAPVAPGERPPVRDGLPTVLLAAMVALLAGASALPQKPALTNGLICTGLLAAGLVYTLARRGPAAAGRALRAIDGGTLALLAGVFVVVGGLQAAGALELLAGRIAALGGGNLCLVYTALVWGSVACSALVDNIPYVAAMLPVAAQTAALLDAPPALLYFGLLVGATLGGNLTPVGASANIAGIGVLRRAGYPVKNRDFVRIGVPFTVAAVTAGYALLWLLWA